MDKLKNYDSLKKFCLEIGVDFFGVTDISVIKNGFAFSQSTLAKMDSAVCLGLRLSTAILEENACIPTRIYSHHYKTANDTLDQLAFKTASYIQKSGYLSLPIAASQILDWQKQTGHLSHKKIAYLAGLGWIGRNNLLVTRQAGCQLRLATILTDMPLKTDKPSGENCGECRLCIKVCPAEAIKERSADFEHLKCFEKCKEFQKARLVDQNICGVCVSICKGKKDEGV